MKSNNPVRMAVALLVLVVPTTKNLASADQLNSADKALKTSAMQASLVSPARGFTNHVTFTDGLTYQAPVRPTQAQSPSRDIQPATTIAATSSHQYDTLFMMLGIFGLVIVQLRRKQNSLPHHPLSLPPSKPSAARQTEQRTSGAVATSAMPTPIAFTAAEEAV